MNIDHRSRYAVSSKGNAALEKSITAKVEDKKVPKAYSPLHPQSIMYIKYNVSIMIDTDLCLVDSIRKHKYGMNPTLDS